MRLCILVLVLCISTPALAQQEPSSATPKLIISERAIAMGMAASPPSPARQSRDSVKNGAVIGALIGGVALGGFSSWICHMLREPSDPPCWKGVVVYSAIGAGIGAASGAGVDAIFTRQPTIPGSRDRRDR